MTNRFQCRGKPSDSQSGKGRPFRRHLIAYSGNKKVANIISGLAVVKSAVKNLYHRLCPSELAVLSPYAAKYRKVATPFTTSQTAITRAAATQKPRNVPSRPIRTDRSFDI
jgi:hypothetical protein